MSVRSACRAVRLRDRVFREAFGRDPGAGAADGYGAMSGVLRAIRDAGAAGNDRTAVLDAYL